MPGGAGCHPDVWHKLYRFAFFQRNVGDAPGVGTPPRRVVGKERALVFSTGYQVNVGVISSMVARDDFAITDKDDHASIVDGCRLSFGTMKRFPHNDLEGLERILASLPERAGRLVIIDGVYSMGGDIAPLPETIEVCKKYGARLMVDDAHSIGDLGGGRGTAAEFGVTADVDLIMGTFSKSFASLGGFIAGDDVIVDYIQHHARSLIFSASIPPANAAAAMAALEVMHDEPERVKRLNDIGAYMRRRYRELGFNIGVSETPIIPVVIGEDTKAQFTRRFDMAFIPAVFWPAAREPSPVANCYMATHTDERLEKVLQVFGRWAKLGAFRRPVFGCITAGRSLPPFYSVVQAQVACSRTRLSVSRPPGLALAGSRRLPSPRRCRPPTHAMCGAPKEGVGRAAVFRSLIAVWHLRVGVRSCDGAPACAGAIPGTDFLANRIRIRGRRSTRAYLPMGAAIFDGQVGNAAPHVERAGGDECARRASVETAGAISTIR